MKSIRVEKLTLNMGTGVDQEVLKKAMKLMQGLTGTTPVKTTSKKRIPNWNLRPGLPIGCKITLRGKHAIELLKSTLKARENVLTSNCFDNDGNVSFGIKEHIDIPGQVYNPEIGIMGLQVTATLERPGYRVKKRKISKNAIGKAHLIKKEEAIQFFKDEFKINVVESQK